MSRQFHLLAWSEFTFTQFSLLNDFHNWPFDMSSTATAKTHPLTILFVLLVYLNNSYLNCLLIQEYSFHFRL